MAKVAVNSYAEKVVTYCGVLNGVATWQTYPWDLGFSSRELSALVVHKARAHLAIIDATIDGSMQVAIAIGSRSLLGLTPNLEHLKEPSTYLFFSRRLETAAAGQLIMDPLEVDYTSLPQGGIIVPATKMNVNVAALNCATSWFLTLELWISVVELDQANLLDLAQAMMGYPL